MKRIPNLATTLIALLCVAGCVFTGAPVPETAREKYAAAEASYNAIVTTVDQLATTGSIRQGSPAAVSLATTLRTTRSALDVWGGSPDDLSRQQAALTALAAVQHLLVTLQTEGRSP